MTKVMASLVRETYKKIGGTPEKKRLLKKIKISFILLYSVIKEEVIMKSKIRKKAYSATKAIKKSITNIAKPEHVKPGFKKQYLKSGNSCRVTFRLPKDAAPKAHKVAIVGDFNDWNLSKTRMKKLKNGDYSITLSLHSKREYRFRYLIDDNRWENDWGADKYIPNPFGCDDSVIIV